jgi:hypothetical protein
MLILGGSVVQENIMVMEACGKGTHLVADRKERETETMDTLPVTYLFELGSTS